MNSFTLHAVGNLIRDPEQLTRGGKTYTRICLSGNDFIAQEAEGGPRETVTTLWLAAFGTLGEVIARNSRKGDQLIVEARVSSHVDRNTERVDTTFILTGFRFGAPGRMNRERLEEAEAEAESGAVGEPAGEGAPKATRA
jgi:single-stranded DNA-binding protein